MEPVKRRRVSDPETSTMLRKKEKHRKRRKSLSDALSGNNFANKYVTEFGYQNKIRLCRRKVILWHVKKDLYRSRLHDKREGDNRRKQDSTTKKKEPQKTNISTSDFPLKENPGNTSRPCEMERVYIDSSLQTKNNISDPCTNSENLHPTWAFNDVTMAKRVEEIVIISSDEEDDCFQSKAPSNIIASGNDYEYDVNDDDDDENRLTIDESWCEETDDRSGIEENGVKSLDCQGQFRVKHLSLLTRRNDTSSEKTLENTYPSNLEFNLDLSKYSSSSDPECFEMINEQSSVGHNEPKSVEVNFQGKPIKSCETLPDLNVSTCTTMLHTPTNAHELSGQQEHEIASENEVKSLADSNNQKENQSGKVNNKLRVNTFGTTQRRRRGNNRLARTKLQRTSLRKLPPWAFGNEVTNVAKTQNVMDQIRRKRKKTDNKKTHKVRKYHKKGTASDEAKKLASETQNKECDHRIERDLPNHNWLEHKLHEGSMSHSSNESVAKTALLSAPSNSSTQVAVPSSSLQFSADVSELPQISISCPTPVITTQKKNIDISVEGDSIEVSHLSQQGESARLLSSATVGQTLYHQQLLSDVEKNQQEKFIADERAQHQRSKFTPTHIQSAVTQNNFPYQQYSESSKLRSQSPSFTLRVSPQMGRSNFLQQQLSPHLHPGSSLTQPPQQRVSHQPPYDDGLQQQLLMEGCSLPNSQSLTPQGTQLTQDYQSSRSFTSSQSNSSPLAKSLTTQHQNMVDDTQQKSPNLAQLSPQIHVSSLSHMQQGSPLQHLHSQELTSVSPQLHTSSPSHLQQGSPYQQSHNQMKQPLSSVSPQLHSSSPLLHLQRGSPLQQSHNQLQHVSSVPPQLHSSSPLLHSKQGSPLQQLQNQLQQQSSTSVSPQLNSSSPSSYLQKGSPFQQSHNQMKQLSKTVSPQLHSSSPLLHLQQRSPHQSHSQLQQQLSVPSQLHSSSPSLHLQQGSLLQQPHNQLQQPSSTSVSPQLHSSSPSLHLQQGSLLQQPHNQLQQPSSTSVSPQLQSYSPLLHLQQGSPLQQPYNQLKQPLSSVSSQLHLYSPSHLQQEPSSSQQSHNQLKQQLATSISPRIYPPMPSSQLQQDSLPLYPDSLVQEQSMRPGHISSQVHGKSQSSPPCQLLHLPPPPQTIEIQKKFNETATIHQRNEGQMNKVGSRTRQKQKNPIQRKKQANQQFPQELPVSLQQQQQSLQQLPFEQEQQQQSLQQQPVFEQQHMSLLQQQQMSMQQQRMQQRQMSMQQQQQQPLVLQDEQIPQLQQQLHSQQQMENYDEMPQQCMVPNAVVGMEVEDMEMDEAKPEQDPPPNNSKPNNMLVPYNQGSQGKYEGILRNLISQLPEPIGSSFLTTLAASACEAYDKGRSLTMFRLYAPFPYNRIPLEGDNELALVPYRAEVPTTNYEVQHLYSPNSPVYHDSTNPLDGDEVVYLTTVSVSPQPAVPFGRKRYRLQSVDDNTNKKRRNSHVPMDLTSGSQSGEDEYAYVADGPISPTGVPVPHAIMMVNRGRYQNGNHWPPNNSRFPGRSHHTPFDVRAFRMPAHKQQQPNQYGLLPHPRMNLIHPNQMGFTDQPQHHHKAWPPRQHPGYQPPNRLYVSQQTQHHRMRRQQTSQQQLHQQQLHQQHQQRQQQMNPQQIYQHQQQQRQQQLYRQQQQQQLHQQQPNLHKHQHHQNMDQHHEQNSYYRGTYEKNNDQPQSVAEESLSSPKGSAKFACYNCSCEAQFTCSGCRSVLYCTRQCQAKHWKQHAEDCQRLKKLAESCK